MAFRFLFLTDSQLGCYASFTGLTQQEVAAYAEKGMKVRALPKAEGFEWDAARFEAAMQQANELEPAFVVVGGDMIDDLSSDEQHAELMRLAGLLDPAIPIHWVPGNHDVAFDAVRPTEASLERYRSLFGDDRYSFSRQGVRFVVLNTTLLAVPAALPQEAERHLDEMEEQLAMGAEEGERIVALGHHPLFLRSPEEPDSYWTVPGTVRGRILDLFKRHGVEVMFSGHWHRNSIAMHDGFEMVVSGAVGFPLGDDPSGYRVVEVGPEGIRHSYHSLGLPPPL